jgi:hypothetical protein
MEKDMENQKQRKKAPRQEWKPHWSIALVLKVLESAFGIVKIAAGALATVALICGVCVLVFISLLGDYLQEDIAPMASVELPVTDQNSYVLYLDNDGKIKELQRIFPENNSDWVDIEDIPQRLIDATIAIEDKRFYEHQGVDWITRSRLASLCSLVTVTAVVLPLRSSWSKTPPAKTPIPCKERFLRFSAPQTWSEDTVRMRSLKNT